MRPAIRSVLFTILLLAAALAASGSVLPASAASTITVSTCDESSLTQAINNAAAGDTIDFGCSGTITFAGSRVYVYTLLKNLTIDGSGQNVILNGNLHNAGDFIDGTSIFKVPNGVTLTLNNLTFTGGVGGTSSMCQTCTQTDSGGVITVEQGTVNISNSTFTNNISTGLTGGGAILATLGTVHVSNSTFTNNTAYDSGGAIQSLAGTLTVTNSTFSGNLTRGDGGGIHTIGGTATISNSTFTNNTANAYSGEGSGAGIANTGSMTITNSTFSGNHAEAGGAIANQTGTLNLTDSTLVGNHANWWGNGLLTGTRDDIALALGGTTNLKNTILANGPTRSGSADAFTFGGNCVTNGTLNDGGGNYSDDETCPGNHVSKDDLHLGTLASNGGPTQTIAITTDSVAKDAVACISTIDTDQRGFTRSTSGDTCDAGAFEFGAVNPIKSTTISAVSGSGTYGSTATLTATLKTGSTAVSSKTITFKLNGSTVGTATTNSSGVATLSGVSLSGIGGGTHTGFVSASFAGDSSYSSSSGSGTLTVSKADQTLSFDLSTLPDKSLGDPAFDISSYASATSGLTVSFTSLTTDTCTVSGSNVTLVAVGTCTLQAEQAGDDNYNAASPVQQSLNVADTTPPVTTATAVNGDNSAYTFGDWTHQTVTVTLSAVDPGTGVASTSYTLDGGGTQNYTDPFTVSGEGIHTITFSSTDNANNVESTVTKTVKIDTTPPTITGTATTSPNANGWYNTAVTIHWTCSDALSGIAICPADQTISTEGTTETTATAVDAAHNQTTATSSPSVSIDLTAPTNVSGSAERAADHNGWYTSPVTITFSGTGAISGIDSCTSTTYSGPDSATASVSGTCTDRAGNTSAPVDFGFQYDATAPTNVVGSADRMPDSNGWYNHSVGITFAGQDSVSGIASCTSTSYSGPDSATAAVPGTCTDNAGNTSTPVNFNLQYDATAPTDVAATFERDADSNGWYNHAVDITFSGDDASSGIANCTSTTYSGPDTANASVSGSCTDVAGNTSDAVSTTLNYDATAPTNVVATPDRAPNGAGWYNAPVTFSYTGEDATSGIGGCAPVIYGGPDNATASVSGGCTDVAGNPTLVSTTIAYDATAPVVTLASDKSSYTLLQTVTISCTVSDSLSGVVSPTCTGSTAPAYSYNIGSNTVQATATDIAGNVGTGSVTFTVTGSSNDLTTLTNQFVGNRTLAQRISAPLGAVVLAERMHNEQMKQRFIATYVMLVNQQRGRALTNQEADTLIRLAEEL